MRLAFYFLPLVMLAAGIILRIAPAKKPNLAYGFRTKTSCRNEQTWAYCNRLCAKVMILVGFVSIMAIFATERITAQILGLFSAGEMVNILAMGIVLLSIPVIDYCCKRKFPDLF